MISVRAGYPGDGMKLTGHESLRLELRRAMLDEADAYRCLENYRNELTRLRPGSEEHRLTAMHTSQQLAFYRAACACVIELSRKVGAL